jgi:SNF2 family DNA or RNA helicase
MAKLRDYQVELSDKAAAILRDKNLVYFSVMVRVGKSLIALETCRKFGAKRVLFITKIKAFSSIQSDYNNFGFDFHLDIINKESIHKIESNNYDVIIYDEAHQYGAFPKPGTNQKELVKRFSNIPCILMTGTSTPESYSQIYHQLQLSASSPFRQYSNFYKWCKDFVKVKQRNLGYSIVNDYSDADFAKIKEIVQPFTIYFTQAEAGFETNVKEFIIEVKMKPITNQIITKLKKDLVVVGTSGTILADTGAKLMQKEHQLTSGTIKFEDGTYAIIDDTKAQFIKNRFRNFKIAIFYKYVAQLESLKIVLGDKLTTDLDEFNNSDKWIALQFVSGKEGINLSKADFLVMAEIDFSAVTYWQARDRMTTINRKENIVYWIMAEKSIEQKIYKLVQTKKNFTTKHYERTTIPIKDYQKIRG